MILFVASVLFLKVLCLIDGDAKDEEDARSTKDIVFDDVLCVLCYPPTLFELDNCSKRSIPSFPIISTASSKNRYEESCDDVVSKCYIM